MTTFLKTLARWRTWIVNGFLARLPILPEVLNAPRDPCHRAAGLSAHVLGWADRLDKRLSAVEASMRVLETQKLRLKAVEKQAGDAALSMRSLETTLNGLCSDIPVVREILQRMENGNRSHDLPR